MIFYLLDKKRLIYHSGEKKNTKPEFSFINESVNCALCDLEGETSCLLFWFVRRQGRCWTW